LVREDRKRSVDAEIIWTRGFLTAADSLQVRERHFVLHVTHYLPITADVLAKLCQKGASLPRRV